jgi:SpoVK/Ycf46/Vps4 family AAA+-type ATPase
MLNKRWRVNDKPHHTPAAENSVTADEFTLWSRGQREASEHLIEIAEAFFEMDWRSSALRPRFDPLIVGPTGVGKSHVVRVLSRKLGIPRMRLSYGEWLVMGSRESPHTLERLHAFVEENHRGIIFIDELDKFRSNHTSDWSTSVFVELFLLLDRSVMQPSRGLSWTPLLQAKLRNSFVIVGAGTWQTIWSKRAKPSLGFGKPQNDGQESLRRAIEKSNAIPSELLRRFRSELIILPPAEAEDYRRGAKSFGLDRLAHQLGIELDYAEAAESQLGARWLEEVFARLLCLSRKMAPGPDSAGYDETEFDSEPPEEIPF